MSLTSSLRTTWHRLPLSQKAKLPRSSHNVYLSPTGNQLSIFGGEIKPRQPVDAAVHSISPLPLADARKTGQEELDWSSEDAGAHGQGPAARVGACGCKDSQGNWYIWSGRGGKDMAPLAYSTEESQPEDLWKWSSSSGKWTSLQTSGQKPETRSYATMTHAPASRKMFVHAGCPASGRLGTLHQLDMETMTWSDCPDAPREGRGGTVLAAVQLSAGSDADASGGKETLLRWGGFCGHELGGPLDIYDIATKKWTSVEVGIEGGAASEPPKRSVHGFVGLPTPLPIQGASGSSQKAAIAVLFFGEGDGAPKELGHDGAGKFLNDVWLLLFDASSQGYSWLKIEPEKVDGEGQPEARGWFAFDACPALGASGEQLPGVRIGLHGGLNEDNKRLSDAWILDIQAAS